MPGKTRVPRGVVLAVCLCAALMLGGSAAGQVVPPANFKVAFIGDQGLGSHAEAVLELIAQEGADAVVHAGDFDYDDDPAAWDAQINAVLGPEFPYFAAAGNHDDDVFYGAGGYQEKLAARMAALAIPWDGDLGVRSSHHYQGIFFVLTAPDVFGDGDEVHAPYIHDQLAADDSAWRISAWHVLMEAMQVGGKSDQSGWGVYEQSRRGGAIIATGHEHSYARSHPLSSMVDQVVATTDHQFRIFRDDPATGEDEGVTFAFHNGLGGRSIRDQERCFPTEPPYGCNGEWASVYAEQQDADYGALFGQFHYANDPCLARFYFKDVNGNVPDEFFVRSTVGPCAGCRADLDGDGVVGQLDVGIVRAAWGRCAGPCPADLNLDGTIDVRDLMVVFINWGPC